MRFGLTVSAIMHAVLLLWAMLSFTAKPLVAAAPDSLPVDIISDTQFSQLTKGVKNAPKPEVPKPLVDQTGEQKPAETPTAAISERPEIKPIPKETQPASQPPEQKPVEKVEKPQKKEPQVDPIAEAIKKDQAKQRAEAKAKAKAEALAKNQPKFDADEVKALLDKRDARRNVATGDTPNQTPTLGTSAGSAAVLSQSEVDALRARLMQLWNPPAGAQNPDELVVKIRIKLKRDGTLADGPMVMTSGQSTLFQAARDGAVRALYKGQPYDMLKPEHYELWKEMEITFDPREMSG